MSVYAIGDLQGCFDELEALLDKINFDENNDQLWFTGDLVNRGPKSLECLRFVKNLGKNAVTVLGNHDLHLLAIANGQKEQLRKADTLDSILSAPDKDDLLNWLKQCPLLHHDIDLGYTLIHAGLPPQWDLEQANECANEVESVLTSKKYKEFYATMYGKKPDTWSDELTGWDRLRFITNCFTRLRYCASDNGCVEFKEKGPPGTQAKPYVPWFEATKRKSKDLKIIFGHWSTVHLGNISNFSIYNVYPLDTGCLWGGELTAIRLEDEEWFSVPSRQQRKFDL